MVCIAASRSTIPTDALSRTSISLGRHGQTVCWRSAVVDGITLDHRTILKGTHFDAASVVVGVLRSSDDGDHRMRNYVPDECREILSQHGAVVETCGRLKRVDENLRLFLKKNAKPSIVF